jgi:hypothetical protein
MNSSDDEGQGLMDFMMKKDISKGGAQPNGLKDI